MEDEIYVLLEECFKYLPFQGQKNIIEGMWSWYLEVDNHYKVTDEDVMEDQIYVLPENMSIYLHQNPPFQPQQHVIEFMWKDE